MSGKNGNSVLSGLFWGLIAGAAFTLLYTPKSGKELREDLKHKVDELPDEVDKLLSDIRDLYNKSSEMVISMGKEQCDKLKEALSEAEKAIKSKAKSNSEDT